MLKKYVLKKSNIWIKNAKKAFSLDLNIPIIDYKKYMNKGQGWQNECKLVSDCLHETGILAIKDPVYKLINIYRE